MAQRTTITLVDDIDGSQADGTVTFSLDGVAFEIDLTSEHERELRAALEPWVTAARRTSGRTAAGRSRSSRAMTGPSAEQVREWAKANGRPVSDRGRISAAVRAAYEAAH